MPFTIVPIPVPSKHYNAIRAAGTQNLEYHGGPLLSDIVIKAVYWGDAWQTDATAAPLRPRLPSYLQWIVTSPLIDQLTEYSTGSYSIGQGTYAGEVSVPGALPASTSDSDVQAMLTTLWQTQPSLGPNAAWIVLVPPNVSVSAFNEQSCVDFCGYHSNINNTTYTVAPFPSCDGCLGGMSAFDSLTSMLSHEICESITDPLGTGWYAASGYEIGDLCAVPVWQTKTLNGYVVQKEWSNKQGACL